MALMTTPSPDISNAKSLQEQIKVLLDNYSMLRKELQFMLQNLSIKNFDSTTAKKLSSSGIDDYLDADKNLIADRVAGTLNTAIAKVQNSTGTVSFVEDGIMIHDFSNETESTEAIKLTSAGILIAYKKDIDGNWIWRTAVTGISISADAIATGTLSAININGVNITGSTMYVQNDDGSSTKIDGSGITRIFSVPIFTDMPSNTNVLDDFETGQLANTRIDLPNCIAGTGSLQGNKTPDITIISTEKYAGSYCLRLSNPTPEGGILVYDPTHNKYVFNSRGELKCQFLNYRPTKDSTFSFKYKLPTIAPLTTVKIYVDDLDYPEVPTNVISLGASTNWQTFELLLTGNHTYQIYLIILANDSGDAGEYQELTQTTPIYIDDMIYELGVNESVITGYEEGTKPYNDFTYIRKDEILTGTTQKQITLPDYFRGLNFDVLISPRETYAAPTLLSINNKVPSFTVSGENTKFIYTVILNN